MTAWRSQNFRFVSIGKLNWSFKCACLLYANLLKWLAVYWNESKLMQVFFKVFLTRPNKDKMLATSAKRQGRWTQDCRLSFVFEFEIWWNEMQIFGRFEWKKVKFLFKSWGCLEKRNFVFQFCCQEKKREEGETRARTSNVCCPAHPLPRWAAAACCLVSVFRANSCSISCTCSSA